MEFLLWIFILFPILALCLALSGVFSKRSIAKGDLLKYTNDFLELYEENENDFKNEIVEFKKIERIKNVTAIIVETCLLMIALYELNINLTLSLFLFLFSIVVLFAIVVLNNKYRKKYKEMFKDCIIKPYVEKSIPDLKYDPNGGIDELDYRQANFDNKTFNEVYTDDYITGEVTDDVYMDLSEIKTVNNVEKRNKKDFVYYKNSTTQFHGMCAILKSTKFNFTPLYVRKDKFKLLPERMRIKIDSPDFEKYFDAYSENRTEAKRLLDFQVINHLVKFKVESGLTFEIVFKGSNIYVRFFTGPMFEPCTLSKIKEKEMLWIYHSITQFIRDLVPLIVKRERKEDTLIDKSIKSENPFNELNDKYDYSSRYDFNNENINENNFDNEDIIEINDDEIDH